MPLLLLAAAALAGCATPKPAGQSARSDSASRYPPFAAHPFAPFTARDVVAVALREWRLFGSPVDDDPPGSRPAADPEAKPERQPGLWQRVGEYWWLGMSEGRAEAGWTGKHDETGTEFRGTEDGLRAWSAAFISYVMRIAGAGDRFPYSFRHADYINAAVEGSAAVHAERLERYALRQGDLICLSRRRRPLHFDDLPADPFPAHCDIVVAAEPGLLTVVGGNVDDAVTLKHVPTTPDGRIAAADGTVLDPRYPWFVAIRVQYDPDGPAAPAAPSADRAMPASRSASAARG